MQLTNVGSGEFHVTANQEDVLVVYNVGEAIAMMIFDPIAKVGGLLHFGLPDSGPTPDRARQQPAAFADTGIPLFFKKAAEFGAQKDQMVIHAVGGAQVAAEPGAPQIGKKNYLAMRKILWKTGVLIKHENIGGTVSRTAALQLDTGRVAIREVNENPEFAIWDFQKEQTCLNAF